MNRYDLNYIESLRFESLRFRSLLSNRCNLYCRCDAYHFVTNYIVVISINSICIVAIRINKFLIVTKISCGLSRKDTNRCDSNRSNSNRFMMAPSRLDEPELGPANRGRGRNSK